MHFAVDRPLAIGDRYPLKVSRINSPCNAVRNADANVHTTYYIPCFIALPLRILMEIPYRKYNKVTFHAFYEYRWIDDGRPEHRYVPQVHKMRTRFQSASIVINTSLSVKLQMAFTSIKLLNYK